MYLHLFLGEPIKKTGCISPGWLTCPHENVLPSILRKPRNSKLGGFALQGGEEANHTKEVLRGGSPRRARLTRSCPTIALLVNTNAVDGNSSFPPHLLVD